MARTDISASSASLSTDGSRERPAVRAAEARRYLRLLLASPTGLAGLSIVLIVILVALLASIIAPVDPSAQDIIRAMRRPFWLGGAEGGLLGTDNLGRDIFSRIIFGSRVSLTIGLASVAIAGAFGCTLGMAAGFYGGRLDSIIMRLADFQLSVPFIVLAIAVLGVLGPGLLNLILVLGITGWVTYARIARSEVLSLRSRDFVQAAHALGASSSWVMLRHILPNLMNSMIVLASLEVARMIISEAALSFLGLGVPPSTPSWGGMIADGRNYLETAWWIATFPGLAIVLTVLGINLFGDWLRDALDPRRRGVS